VFDLAILAIAFIVILAGAELFTNGIEWFGRKLGLAEGAVGSVLAAVGTALPETMIPIVAIVFTAGVHSDEIGVGAILGAPFMLATLAMFVTGAAVWWQARRRPTGDAMLVDAGVLRADILAFAVTYAIAIGAALVLPAEPTWPKVVVAVILLLSYGRYVMIHFEADPSVDLEDLAPLRFHRLDRPGRRIEPSVPRLRVVNLQVLFAVGLIVVGAVEFVGAVEHLSRSLGVSEVLLALVIAPIATELPEKFNSIIWVRHGKDTLALGNITGAMVFQAAIPTSVALLFAPEIWTIGQGSYTAFASAAIAFIAMAVIYLPALLDRTAVIRGRRLLIGGIFYAAYLGLVAYVIVAG
jgi:cation:H+ antiporter